jgi:hypothetical protein
MSKNYKHILLYLALLLFGSSLYAQDLNPSDFSNPNTLNYTQTKSNVVALTQVGTKNNADLIQAKNTSTSTPNLTRVLQEGDLNLAQVVQSGGLMKTDVYQKGNSNVVLSNVQGYQNTTLLVQNGSNNTIVQNITNSSQINTEFIQNGNGNRIEQTIVNQSNQSYKLTQNGDNLNAVIRQGVPQI